MPAAWSGQTDARSPATPLAAWWRRFDDALLVALVDDALRANTSVRSAQAALAQARALSAVQGAALLPSLAAQGSAQRSRAGVDHNATSSSAFRAGFDASWEPDIFGGRRAAVRAAEADTLASAASLGDVQVSVAAEVALNYLQLRGLQARSVIASASVFSLEETLQLTQWRQQAGLLTALEVDQAQAALAQTRATLPPLRAQGSVAEHALAVLTHRAPGELSTRLAAEAAPANGLLTPPADLVLAIPAAVLRQRPDVRAAESRVQAAAARVQQADAARLPGFSVGASLGLASMTLDTLTRGSSVLSSLLASVAAPLFDGGAGRAQVRAQQAALDQAHAAWQAALLLALQDVEDSLVTLRQDRLRQTSLRVAADAALNAATLARQRYASGLIDFQVVLETQRTALATQDSLASAATGLQTDHVRLFKALGGGWQPSTAQALAAQMDTPTP